MNRWSEMRCHDGSWRVTPEIDVEASGTVDRALWAAIEPDYDTSVEFTVFESAGEVESGRNHVMLRTVMVPVKYGWLTRFEERRVVSASTSVRKFK